MLAGSQKSEPKEDSFHSEGVHAPSPVEFHQACARV